MLSLSRRCLLFLVICSMWVITSHMTSFAQKITPEISVCTFSSPCWYIYCPGNKGGCLACASAIQGTCIAAAQAEYDACINNCDPQDPQYLQCKQDCSRLKLELLAACTADYLDAAYCCNWYC